MAHTLLNLVPIKPKLRFSTIRSCASSTSQMDHQGDQRPKFKDFPYVSAPIKDLMLDLVSKIESRMESQLLPCTLPQELQYYENQTGTAHGSIFLRSATSTSPIDFITSSWLHCELPTGASLNIASLTSYMNDKTDIPQLVIEFIQNSPTSIVILLDLPHRKDLVLHPDYLKFFYEDTPLESKRQIVYKIPEVQPYVSPSLYIRSVWSPTACVIRVDTTAIGGVERLEEILKGTVSEVTKEVLGIWLDFCALEDRNCNDDDERINMRKRDRMFKQMSIEIDLGRNLPMMFGQEITDRIVNVLLGT